MALTLALTLALVTAAAVGAATRKPRIESISVSKVTERGAELQARIDPEGSRTQFTFFVEYKLCQGEGTCNALWRQEEVGSGTIAAGRRTVTVSTKLHLSPGCAYEYHVVAANSAGSSHTGEMPGERSHEFTTKHRPSLPEPHYCEA